MTFRASRIVPVLAGLAAIAVLAFLRASAAESIKVVQLSGNRFVPGDVIVHAGDSVAFVNVGGGIHNIAFREDSLTPDERRMLDQAMPEREEFRATGEAPLASPLLVKKDEVYGFRVPDLPPGRYDFFCSPHASAGMRGTLVVVP